VVRLEASAKEKPAGGTEKQTAGEIKPETIKGKIVEFLWKLEKDGRTKGTIKNYSRMLNGFLKNNINPFDPEEVKDYIAKAPFELSTKDNFCRMLNVWFRFLGINWQQPKYTYSAKIPFIPTEQELDQLIAGCGRKTATFLQLLKETGARAGEIGKLTWNDIDFERRIVRISAEKGSLPRMLPISLKVINMLENIKKNVNSNRIFIRDSIYVNFSIARKRIAQKLANPRILNITFHTFRHWKATMEYHKTKDILHVKELLGHRNLESTQIYIHIERTLFTNAPPEEFHVKVAKTQEEITQLLEAGFEYVLQKDGLAFFRKRK
jgi:integrase